MLRKLRSLFTGKLNHNREYNLRRSPLGRYRGRFETLEDRRMLSGDYRLVQEIDNPIPGTPFVTGNDTFGFELAVEGDTIVASDAIANNVGQAYLIDIISGTTQTIANPEPDALDLFGSKVAISGDRVTISAPQDDVGSGTQSSDAGSVYVFDANSGTLLNTLISPDLSNETNSDLEFGSAIAMSSDYIVVTAIGSDIDGTDSGRAYVFDATTGQHLHTLLNPEPSLEFNSDISAYVGDNFGTAVSINGERILISSPHENDRSGTTYVYDLTNLVNGLPALTIANPDPVATVGEYDQFGISIETAGDNAVIGLRFGDASGFTDDGSAYLFDIASSTYTSLVNPDAGDNSPVQNTFGEEVGITASGSTIAVAAANSSINNSAGDVIGRVYLYEGSTASHLQTIAQPGGQDETEFGRSLAITEDWLVVGATAAGDPSYGAGKIYIYASERVWIVNDERDIADTTPGDGIVDVDVATGNQVTLRAAIQEANAYSTANNESVRIILPEGTYQLNLTDIVADSDAIYDLDVTGDITIVGDGAGFSVVEAAFTTAGASTRVFEVANSGSLRLEALTVTGGDTTGVGGGINVVSGGALTIEEVAVVGNTASGDGGAVFNAGTSTFTRSVIAENSSGDLGGGIRNTGTATVNGSVVAKNTATNGGPDLHGTFTSDGENMLTDVTGATGFGSDHVDSTVDFVVTSLVDRADANLADSVAVDSDGFTTLRSAVQEANDTTGTDRIWLPAWVFELTIAQDTGLPQPYMDSTTGDLVILENLAIRGITNETAVDGTQIAIDDVFEVLGDFNNSNSVNASDFFVWQRREIGADADEDGDVDGADKAIWEDYYGVNTLFLTKVMQIV